MKFSEIEKEQWDELKPYLDTCLLPLTGLKGSEEPWEATAALERLRDALETIEIPFTGRVVTYPALHYATGVDAEQQIRAVVPRLKEAGFRYVIVLTADPQALQGARDEADLFIAVDMEDWTSRQSERKAEISAQVQQLWQRGN